MCDKLMGWESFPRVPTSWEEKLYQFLHDLILKKFGQIILTTSVNVYISNTHTLVDDQNVQKQ